LRSLPRIVASRALQLIEELKIEPHPRKALKLSGSERLYRIRVGAYRIIYEIDIPAQQITIHYIRHRSRVYESK